MEMISTLLARSLDPDNHAWRSVDVCAARGRVRESETYVGVSMNLASSWSSFSSVNRSRGLRSAVWKNSSSSPALVSSAVSAAAEGDGDAVDDGGDGDDDDASRSTLGDGSRWRSLSSDPALAGDVVVHSVLAAAVEELLPVMALVVVVASAVVGRALDGVVFESVDPLITTTLSVCCAISRERERERETLGRQIQGSRRELRETIDR